MIRPLLITATLYAPGLRALAEANTAPNVRPAQMQPAVPFKMDLPEGWKSVVTGTTYQDHHRGITTTSSSGPLPGRQSPR